MNIYLYPRGKFRVSKCPKHSLPPNRTRWWLWGVVWGWDRNWAWSLWRGDSLGFRFSFSLFFPLWHKSDMMLSRIQAGKSLNLFPIWLLALEILHIFHEDKNYKQDNCRWWGWRFGQMFSARLGPLYFFPYNLFICCTALHHPRGSDGKVSAYNVEDPGSIPGSGRSPGEGNGNPLQYSCPENPWKEEPGRLQSIGSQRVGYDWVTSLSPSFVTWQTKFLVPFSFWWW